MPKQKEPGSILGACLATIRKARGVTQIDLAKAVGTTQRMISYYEAEGGNPPLALLLAFSAALKTTPNSLLGFDGSSELNATDLEERRFWKKFLQLRKLPEKDQRAVFRLINSLSGIVEDDP